MASAGSDSKLVAGIQDLKDAKQQPPQPRPKQQQQALRIGIDFGGVLSVHDRKSNKDQKNKQQHQNTKIDMPGALDVLKRWKAAGHELFLISFCGKKRAKETKASIPEGLFDGLHFVKDKEYKPFVCQHLCCDAMIDDSDDVAAAMAKQAPEIHFYAFKDENSWQNGAVETWLTTTIKIPLVADPPVLLPAAIKRMLYLV